MAIFVDLEEEEPAIELPQDGQAGGNDGLDVVKSLAAATCSMDIRHGSGPRGDDVHESLAVRENPNSNSMTRAFGCYP